MTTNLVQRLLGCISEERKSIVVIGDAMVDVWVHGRTEECQDGCSKFVEESCTRTHGGAANAHRCLEKWPVSILLYTIPENERPFKTRFIDANDKIVYRWDNETVLSTLKSSADRHERIRTDAIDLIKYASAVLLSDYDKGFIPPAFIQEVAARCKQYGVPCVADCKRALETYTGCVLKGNEAWFRKNNISSYSGGIVITQGALAPVVSSHGYIENLHSVKCVNHVGAGDCFAAHLALALAYKFSLREAATLAHSAGRVYVQHAHNKPPYPDEIARDLSNAT